MNSFESTLSTSTFSIVASQEGVNIDVQQELRLMENDITVVELPKPAENCTSAMASLQRRKGSGKLQVRRFRAISVPFRREMLLFKNLLRSFLASE